MLNVVLVKRIRSKLKRLQRFVPNVRRPGALTALAVLFMLAIGGPLACILHCSVWYPLHEGVSGASVHAHHHAAPTHFNASHSDSAQTVLLHAVHGSDETQPPAHPHTPLASAVYECVQVSLLLLVFVIFMQWAQSLPLPKLINRRQPPLLPPPISLPHLCF